MGEKSWNGAPTGVNILTNLPQRTSCRTRVSAVLIHMIASEMVRNPQYFSPGPAEKVSVEGT